MATPKQIESLKKARAAKQAAKSKVPNVAKINDTTIREGEKIMEKFETDNIPLSMPHIVKTEEAVIPTIDPPNTHPITKVPHARMTAALEHTVARAADNLCTGTDAKLLRLVHEWIQAKGASNEWVAEVLNTTVEVVEKMFIEANNLLLKGLLYGNYKAGQHVLQGKGRGSRRVYVPGTDDNFREKYYARASAIAAQKRQQQDIELLHQQR